MKIRILTEQPDGAVLNGKPWPGVGEETDVPTAQAAHLVASGVAEEVTDSEPRSKRRNRQQAEGE